PGRPVVGLIGDGSFNYDPIPAIYGAAQEHNLPFLTVIFNNHGYLSQKTGVPKYYPQGHAVQTGNFSGLHIGPEPDYWKIVEAFGGYGEKVDEPGQVASAIARGLEAIESGKAALLDMRLRPVADSMDRSDK
ncbi:MAG: thiamine pyrophosphate-dependent enzyme, partial [Rhodospirillaceae bacterium]